MESKHGPQDSSVVPGVPWMFLGETGRRKVPHDIVPCRALRTHGGLMEEARNMKRSVLFSCAFPLRVSHRCSVAQTGNADKKPWKKALERSRQSMKYLMKYLVLSFALVLAGSAVAKAESRGIDFGEARTRFQIQSDLTTQSYPTTQSELTAWRRLRPWDLDWRHTYAWQHGRSIRTEFAPRGCYITRWVVTPSGRDWVVTPPGRQLRELFIC